MANDPHPPAPARPTRPRTARTAGSGSPSVSLRLSGQTGRSESGAELEGVGTTAIVVEGGGTRGVFCSGVLDALAAHPVAPFDVALGSSAGAMALAVHLAEQQGLGALAYTEYLLRPGVVDRRRFLRGGPLFDLDRLLGELRREQLVDLASLHTSPTDFRVVVTDVATGQPHHLRPAGADTWDLLKASCALPMLVETPVPVRGRDYIDGGYSDPLPVQQAQAMGADTILVVRTRPMRVTGAGGLGAWGERGLVRWKLRQHRDLVQRLPAVPARYADSLAFARNPPGGTLVVEVAPSRELASGRSTTDRGVLERDYELGLQAGEAAAAVWSVQRAVAGRATAAVPVLAGAGSG